MVSSGIGPWELGSLQLGGSLGELGQLDSAPNRAYRVLLLGEGSTWGFHTSKTGSFRSTVGVSATISLVGMEGIKLHNQPQRRIDRARSVRSPQSQRFRRNDRAVIYSDFINYMEYMPTNWNCSIDSAFSLRNSLHPLAYNVASLQPCGWVASGENCDTGLA